MRRLLTALLLTLTLATPALAQPGPIRAQLDEAVANAVEKQRIRDGHFYAKCPVESRWVAAWSQSLPHLRVTAIDDQPRWYHFGRSKGPRGFWFDITSGHDLGALSKLDKGLRSAMYRALLTPVEAPAGLQGDTVVYCVVENASYDPVKFNLWLQTQCTLTLPWIHYHNDGTLSMAFVTAEQDRIFRRRNLSDFLDNLLQNTLRPIAPYHVDFSWYSKSNFLLETKGVILADNRFSTRQDNSTECLWVKQYEKLYLWENGLLRGIYDLSNLDPDLNESWRDVKHSARNIRALPFSEKEYRVILDRCEDSIFAVHLASLDSTGQPDTANLAAYFAIYGKYDTRHSADIENSIFNLAKEDMQWGSYYLKTYDRKQGRYYNQIDDISFAIVSRSLSQAQTYKQLFPNGKHIAEADEIITFEKACRNYDRNIYLSLYPDGSLLNRFDQFMASEEQRLFQTASLIYEHVSLHDIEETMRYAVYPYMHNFPNGPHTTEINEIYYYGIAFQKQMAAIYTSRYPSGSPRATRLRNLIDIQLEKKDPGRTSQRTKKQEEWIHRQVMGQPFSRYLDLQKLDGGSYQLHSLHISLSPQKRNVQPCTYQRQMATLVMFDRSKGTFYIDDGSQHRYETDSPVLTLKLYLMEGYDDNRGFLYDAEQWFLQSCGNIPSKR